MLLFPVEKEQLLEKGGGHPISWLAKRFYIKGGGDHIDMSRYFVAKKGNSLEFSKNSVGLGGRAMAGDFLLDMSLQLPPSLCKTLELIKPQDDPPPSPRVVVFRQETKA